jgi:hypothetical protein
LKLVDEADCEKYFNTLLDPKRDGKPATKIQRTATDGTTEQVNRFYDSVGQLAADAPATAFEHKIGWVRYTGRIREQLARDIELTKQLEADPSLAEKLGFKKIEWVFFAKESKEGMVGPDQALLAALDGAHIDYTIILPRS